MGNTRRELSLLSAALTIVFAVSACGSDGEPNKASATATKKVATTTESKAPEARAVSIGEPFAVGNMKVTIRAVQYACNAVGCPADPTTYTQLPGVPFSITLASVGNPGLAKVNCWLETASGERIDVATGISDSKSVSNTFMLPVRSTDLKLVFATGDRVSLLRMLQGL